MEFESNKTAIKSNSRPPNSKRSGMAKEMESYQSIFERYSSQVKRLNNELQRVSQKFPVEKRGAFKIETFDFESFCESWKKIKKQPSLHRLWMARLTETGFEEERAKILAKFERLTQQKRAA